MSGKLVLALMAGLGLALMPVGAWAGEPKDLGRGDPDVMFNRLDKNHDGAIIADEIPAGAPEPLKAFLKKADKNSDKKVTADELKEAFKAGPPPMLRQGGEKPRRGGPDGPRPKPVDRPFARPQPPQPPRVERPRLPDPKTFFAMLDKNHDGSLSLEEFTAGMNEFHQPMPRPWGPPPWFQSGQPWHGPQAWGGGPPRRPGPAGGPNKEQLRKMISAVVREEVEKILKEKAEGVRSRPQQQDGKAEPKK